MRHLRRDRLSRIWDPYVTSKPGGTGLGLAIARQTVLAHQGAVSADSRVGGGTEIRFVLPVDGNRNGVEASACILMDILVPIALFVMHRGDGDRRSASRGRSRAGWSAQPIAPAIAPELAAQIERMEQAIDSIAIEVERISEGQRFTTKLLAERGNGAASEPAPTRDREVDMMLARGDRSGPDVIPPGAIEISEAFFATIAIIALGIPIIRAITRRLERAAVGAARRRRPRC